MPSESMITWLETYRSYSSDELNTRITELKKEISVFSSQAAGSKSFTRDLAELRDQLAAAIRAKKENGTPNVSTDGRVDYSGVCVS